MDIEKQIEWLKPDRILKLYDGEKNMLGMTRLFVVGIGKNGADCLIRVKDIAENRFSAETDRIRYLAFGFEDDINKTECRGSELSEGERVSVSVEEAIYKYLDDPDLLSEYARGWFDMNLKNYSTNPPTYGIWKRQSGRIALFHYIDEIISKLTNVINVFSKSDSPLEIILTGNMGDPLFTGSIIDFGYILKEMFSSLGTYTVKVNTLMFAGDTAYLFESDARNLANYYAYTILTKSDIDKFQGKKVQFSQKYTAGFEINSDKPPFNACFIAGAENTYEETLSKAAEKIISAAEFIYKKDDDADRAMSFNLLGQGSNHSFSCLSYDISGAEIPLGEIVSYLSSKIFFKLCDSLRTKTVGDLQLSIYASKVSPDAAFLASRAGAVPKLEFNEMLNPLFSLTSLKKGGEASRRYVTERIDELVQLTEKGAEMSVDGIAEEIENACLSALTDIEKGPFCANEIIRKCLKTLSNEIKKAKEIKEDSDEVTMRREKLLLSDYRKLKSTPAFMAATAKRYYIQTLTDYAECMKTHRTVDIMLNFYAGLQERLTAFKAERLDTSSKLFTIEPKEFLEMLRTESEKSCVCKAFDISNPEMISKLDRLVDDIPESTKELAFKKMRLDSDDDPKTIPREIINLAAKCFGRFLLMGFNDFCEFFGSESSLMKAIQHCFDSVDIKTPSVGETLTRAICPQNVQQGDIAPIKASHKGANYIWNGSPMFNAVIVVQTKNGVKLENFKDYNQWENMRYAFVNDGLKRQGIKLF
ncbi:MAG: hypothetical protein J1F03_07115 [Oscillospiraceae bacterium]|nr:hypothetical protein [Oscillospiraceae bacterium]